MKQAIHTHDMWHFVHPLWSRSYVVRPLLSRPHTFLGNFEAGHIIYVSLCPAIMKQAIHTHDMWHFVHPLWSRSYVVRPLLSRPHTFLGHFEAGHIIYVSLCPAIMKQAIHTHDMWHFVHPLWSRSYVVRPLLSRPHTFLGHIEAGHIIYVSLCPAIMKQATHTHMTCDILFTHCEADHTLFGHH